MWYHDFYADVIYTPITVFDPILVAEKSYTIKPNADGGFKTSPIGGRIGWNMATPKSGRFAFNFELGMKPGVVGHQIYFGAGMGIALANRIKDKPIKN